MDDVIRCKFINDLAEPNLHVGDEVNEYRDVTLRDCANEFAVLQIRYTPKIFIGLFTPSFRFLVQCAISIDGQISRMLYRDGSLLRWLA